MLWDLMVKCNLFLVCFIFSVLLSFVFLIYNFMFCWEKGQTGLYAIILLGKGWRVAKGFSVSLTEQTLTTWDTHTHTLLTTPSQALWFAVLCVMCSIIPCHQRLAPSTSSHSRISVPVNWHFSVFAITHHMVVQLLHTLPPLPVELNRKFLLPLCLV